MLLYFNIATKELREQKATLHTCRCAVDTLLEEIDSRRYNADSDLHDCRLIPKRVNVKGTLSPNSDVASGVCKIQRNLPVLMTEADELAYQNLKNYEVKVMHAMQGHQEKFELQKKYCERK